jgi:putative ABC transport system permease protein
MLAAFLEDLRYAARAFSRSRGFAAVAILTLALGSGVNATVFTFVNALLLRPAPVPDPSSLVSVYTSDFSSGPYSNTSYPDYLSLKTQTTAFDGLAAYTAASPALLQTAEGVERIRVAAASAEFFDVLRIRPLRGRLIGAADANTATTPGVAISERLWRGTFGSAEDVIGRQITIDGQPRQIVGVLPRRFGLDLGPDTDAWAPLGGDVEKSGRGDRMLAIVGRLKSGRSIASAQSELTAIASRLARDYPESNRGILGQPDSPRPLAVLRHTRLPAGVRSAVALVAGIMMAAVILVLLIACANVANLLLTRAAARTREISVRCALGASRPRIVGQMLTESLLLGAAGGALGLLLAMWTSDALPSFFPPDQAELLDASLDYRVFVYTLAVAIGSSVIFGMAPAFQALKTPLTGGLRGGLSFSAGRSGSRLRAALVVGQIALATVLLVSAGLVVRSLLNAFEADLGFGTREAVLVSLEQPAERDAVKGMAFYDAVLERARALPGVQSAALARSLPLGGSGRRGFRPDGYKFQPQEDHELNFNTVSAKYFETMQIPVVAGRAFDATDTSGVRTAIVNDVLARKYYNGDAIGRRITDSSGTVMTIVGVVKTGKHRSLQEPPLPVVYYALPQSYESRMVLVARTRNAAEPLVDSVRRAAADVDRRVAAYRALTWSARMNQALASDRMTAALIGICGVLALLLAAIGVYGVVAYAVARRTREFGVRVALGARPRQVLSLVLGEGVRVTGLGIAFGILGALAATRALRTLLFGVGPFDPITFASVALGLGVIAICATLLPARRALRLDPMIVLREE